VAGSREFALTAAAFEVLDGLTETQLAALVPLLKPWVQREYRRRRRDRAIVALAGCYIGRLGSGRAIAREMSQDLRRFRPRPAPETGKRLLLASVLQLNGGPLRETVIREVLAGKNRQQAATSSAIIHK
jgi:hypothetical protein